VVKLKKNTQIDNKLSSDFFVFFDRKFFR